MNITFLGGAGEYGRSCFLLDLGKTKVLIDCGVMKSGKTIGEQYPRLTKELAKEIGAVFLTHSHEDHTGALPYLAHLGFRGKVFATQETIKQTDYYLKNWQETQLQTMGQLPYGENAEALLTFQTLEQWDKTLIPGFDFDYGKSGHLPGSVWFVFHFLGESVFFSGDFSMESLLLCYDYPKISTPITYAVLDGAYGLERRQQQAFCEEIIAQLEIAYSENNTVLVVVPPFGRGQDLLFLLNDFLTQVDMPILIDEQILFAAREYVQMKEWFKPEVYETYCSLIKWLESSKRTATDIPFIGFYSERSILENTALLHTPEKLDLIFTGPSNQPLIHAISKRKQGTYSIINARYKVHPAVYETEKILRHIKPEQSLLTHSKQDVSDALAAELEDLTGLDVKTAPNERDKGIYESVTS